MKDGSITLRELQRHIRVYDHHPEREHVYFQKLIEEIGELAQAIRLKARPESDGIIKGTIDEELFDVLYYVVGLANLYDIDLQRCFELKDALNAQRYDRPEWHPPGVDDIRGVTE